MRMRAAIGSVLAAALIAACGPTEPDRILFVDARLAVDTLAVGDWTEVTVLAGNAGEDPVQLAGRRCYALRYRMLDPDGAEVYPAGASWECGGWAAAATPPIDPELMIGAGAIDSVVHLWQAVHGYNTVDGSGEPLPPGRYRVVPYVVLADREEVEGDTVELMLTDGGTGVFTEPQPRAGAGQ